FLRSQTRVEVDPQPDAFGDAVDALDLCGVELGRPVWARPVALRNRQAREKAHAALARRSVDARELEGAPRQRGRLAAAEKIELPFERLVAELRPRMNVGEAAAAADQRSAAARAQSVFAEPHETGGR